MFVLKLSGRNILISTSARTIDNAITSYNRRATKAGRRIPSAVVTDTTVYNSDILYNGARLQTQL